MTFLRRVDALFGPEFESDVFVYLDDINRDRNVRRIPKMAEIRIEEARRGRNCSKQGKMQILLFENQLFGVFARSRGIKAGSRKNRTSNRLARATRILRAIQESIDIRADIG